MPKQFLAQLIVFNMAKIHLLIGEPIEAVRCFEKCLSMSIQSGQSYISILSNKGLITWRKLKGENIQAEEECIAISYTN